MKYKSQEVNKIKLIDKQESYKVKVYEKIKEEIIIGNIPQGSDLNERKLSTELGISRTPIREALQMLSHDGWVVIKPYKGATVRTFDKEYIENVLKVRKALEILAVEDAIKHISDEDIEFLKKILDKQEYVTHNYNPTEFMRLDRIFHEKIYKMSNNEILINLLGNLNDIIRFFGIKVLQEKNRSLTTIIEHKNVLKAIIDKDIHSAKKYMEEHMNQTSNKIINT